MKIIDLLNAQPVLADLARKKMAARLSYGIAKNLREIEGELQSYEKARISIMEKYGTLNKETDQYDITDKPAAEKEYNELVQTEIDFKPHLITLAMLEPLDIAPGDIMMIDWMIQDDDDGRI